MSASSRNKSLRINASVLPSNDNLPRPPRVTDHSFIASSIRLKCLPFGEAHYSKGYVFPSCYLGRDIEQDLTSLI